MLASKTAAASGSLAMDLARLAMGLSRSLHRENLPMTIEHAHLAEAASRSAVDGADYCMRMAAPFAGVPGRPA